MQLGRGGLAKTWSSNAGRRRLYGGTNDDSAASVATLGDWAHQECQRRAHFSVCTNNLVDTTLKATITMIAAYAPVVSKFPE